jgi:hypothetical protein
MTLDALRNCFNSRVFILSAQILHVNARGWSNGVDCFRYNGDRETVLITMGLRNGL